MIPKSSDIKVMSNSTNEKAFTINASAEAFRVLSSSLYSNKIQAIVRELSCNAYDAHVMAGIPDTPFEVHLPDSWEPYFSIEDFGVGLDDKDVNTVYTSYFTSTKTESNDLIGGLGLGSKTPFSYTETFTLRARKDGVERTYSAYISSSGGPTVSLMTEVPTTEGNGVKVIVPVKQQDFCFFQNECVGVYRYFKTLPKIVNSELSLDNSIVNQLEESGGLLTTQGGRGGYVTVVMGNVAYTVKVTEAIINPSQTRIWNFINRTNMTIRFEIGELSVAASRETISFDVETIKTFSDKLQSIVDDYFNGIQKSLDTECGSIFDALSMTERLVGSWAWGSLNFNGEKLWEQGNRGIFQDVYSVCKCDLIYVYSFKTSYRSGTIRKTMITPDKLDIYQYKELYTQSKFVILVNDTGNAVGSDTASRRLLRQTTARHVINFASTLDSKTMEEISKIFGGRVEYKMLSEVKKEIAKERRRNKPFVEKDACQSAPRAKKDEVRLNLWDYKSALNNEKFLTSYKNRLCDVSMFEGKRVGMLTITNGEYYAVMSSRGDVSTSSMAYFSKIFDLEYIIVVRPSERKRIEAKIPNTIDIHSLDRKDIIDIDLDSTLAVSRYVGWNLSGIKSDLKNFDSKVATAVVMNYVNSLPYDNRPPVKNLIDHVIFMKIPGLFDQISEVKELVDLTTRTINRLNETELDILYPPGTASSLRFSNINKMISEAGSKVQPIIAGLQTKYPLLQFFSLDKTKKVEIAEYIKLVDESIANKSMKHAA